MISLKGKSILVVDDEPGIRELLSDELSEFGANVVCAENGSIAFGLLKKQQFDVVISDVKMAGGDGLTLLKDMKENLAARPKIFLNSGVDDVSKETANFLGVVEVFSKPFKINKIVQSIAAALGIIAD
ncbi:MAG: response regulator [Bdellovibrionota bacterium]